MIDFDVETTGLQPWSEGNEAFLWIFMDDDLKREAIPFSPSGQRIEAWDVRPAEQAWIAAENCNAMSDVSREENRDRIQAWFDRGKEEGIRAWNAKFDRAFAEASKHFDVPGDGLWYDGMLVAQAIDERRSVALKAVAVQLFGADADDAQKKLKTWLNAENSRRSKVLKDAEKAERGTLRVKYVESTCAECKGKWESPSAQLAGGNCPHCGSDASFTKKNRTRLASIQEADAVIEEAKQLLDPKTGDYRRANYSHVPREIMEPYALEDVILTRRVSDVYEARIQDKKDLRALIEFERKVMDALYAVEKRGLPARQTEYRKLEHEVIANLSELEDRVMELVREANPIIYAKELAGDAWGEDGHWIDLSEDGHIRSYRGGAAELSNFSPNSTAQVIAALKARGADLSYMSKKDGKLSADADNLRAVNDELAVAILNFRAEYKVLSTYVRPMIGRSYVSSMNVYKEPFIAPDSRIHATYRQVAARTGRMSCADPNMQNQPRDDLRLRYNIVAEDGHVLVTCDLSNIEMVLFAAYCGEGKLLDAVRGGDDLHVLTAQMLGLRDRARPGGGVETARQLGKVYNFTTIYGGGLRSIRRYFRCSMDQARLYKQRYAKAYPEVTRLQNRIQHRLEDDGYIQDKLISGRRFRVAVDDAYKATNYLVQGTAAALLKDAVISLHADGVPMVALVHDEIVAHVRQDEASDVARLIEKRMTQAAAPGGQLWVPEHEEERWVEVEGEDGQTIKEQRKVVVPAAPVVPLRAEADIVERWSDAKPLKDDDGRPYLFTPQWAGGEKRYLKEAV